MRIIILILCILEVFMIQKSIAQEGKNSKLYIELKKMDSLFFDVGYNQCDLKAIGNIIHDDVEFYHDKVGMIESKEAFLKVMKENLCSNPDVNVIRRMIEGTLEVFPLYNNGVLYGAIQNGRHEFYIAKGNKEPFLTSSAHYTHLWILENSEWKIKRVLTFNHQKP